MKTIEGIYNNGEIKLLDRLQLKGQFRVLVQFMKFPALKKTRQKKDPIEDFKIFAKKISKMGRKTNLTDFVIKDRERH